MLNAQEPDLGFVQKFIYPCVRDPRAPSAPPPPVYPFPTYQDAARVCNALARTNVRALGDSRLSLSRSMTQLEQLNTRMDGTASGFARYFGAGGQPREGGSV